MKNRNRALELVEEGMVDPMLMLRACLNHMSEDDVGDMLDLNELSGRFEEEEYDEDVEDMLNNFNYVGSRHHY